MPLSPAFQIIDPRMKRYLVASAAVERIATGMRWNEGPVYFGDGGYLLWSDIPNNRIMRWFEGGHLDIYRAPSSYSNGNTRDREGRLVTCEHGERRVTRTEHDGRITVLADRFEGKRLNSPNDVVVQSDGSIWFTDPPYGILSDYEGHKAESEIGACQVYRVDPVTAAVTCVARDFDKPNGLAFSPDERLLYISDTGRSHAPDGAHHIRVFEVDGERLRGGRRFAEIEPGVADGFRVDGDGNVWSSAEDGVHCLSPAGELLGKILIPETVSNLTFGGLKKNRLFITTATSVYAVYVNQRGAQAP